MFKKKPISTLITGTILGFLIGMAFIILASRLQPYPKIGALIKDPGATHKIQIDAIAPDFELYNLRGEQFQLSNSLGKFIIINFWATWCGPCRVEMPVLQNRFEMFSDKLVVLAVNSQDTPENALKFVEELGLTFDILMDPEGEVHKDYFVRGFPTTFLLDAEGVVRIQHVGVLTGSQLDGYLTQIGLIE